MGIEFSLVHISPILCSTLAVVPEEPVNISGTAFANGLRARRAGQVETSSMARESAPTGPGKGITGEVKEGRVTNIDSRCLGYSRPFPWQSRVVIPCTPSLNPRLPVIDTVYLPRTGGFSLPSIQGNEGVVKAAGDKEGRTELVFSAVTGVSTCPGASPKPSKAICDALRAPARTGESLRE